MAEYVASEILSSGHFISKTPSSKKYENLSSCRWVGNRQVFKTAMFADSYTQSSKWGFYICYS